MQRFIGVPEHFNVPWRVAAEGGGFERAGLEISWSEVAEGSGEMLRLLERGEADAAIVLTEAVVAACSRGQDLRVLGTWVASPLRWGVHVDAAGPIRDVEALRGGRFGISRPGSGSHLMACLEAARRGWPVEALRFETVGAVQSARTAFSEGRIDAYLWEEVTTRPWVRAGEWRCIGRVTPDWPAFLFVCSPSRTEALSARLDEVLDVLRTEIGRLREDPDKGTLEIAKEVALHPDDVRDWFQEVRWEPGRHCDRAALEAAHSLLDRAGALGPHAVDLDRLCEGVEGGAGARGAR